MVYERNTWISARYVLDWTTQRVHGVALRWYIRTYVLVNVIRSKEERLLGLRLLNALTSFGGHIAGKR